MLVFPAWCVLVGGWSCLFLVVCVEPGVWCGVCGVGCVVFLSRCALVVFLVRCSLVVCVVPTMYAGCGVCMGKTPPVGGGVCGLGAFSS